MSSRTATTIQRNKNKHTICACLYIRVPKIEFYSAIKWEKTEGWGQEMKELDHHIKGEISQFHKDKWSVVVDM